MKHTFRTIAAALALAAPASAAVTVSAPVRVPTGVASWVMTSTVTSDEPVTVSVWQSVFQLGTDGRRVRLTTALPAGTSRVGVPCYSTIATYSWWVEAPGVVGSRAYVKCR